MKSLSQRGLLLIACALAATGCASSPRWQVINASYIFSSEGEKDSNYNSTLPVLINTQTGKTWMLYPMTGDEKRVNDDDDHGYSWVPIPVK